MIDENLDGNQRNSLDERNLSHHSNVRWEWMKSMQISMATTFLSDKKVPNQCIYAECLPRQIKWARAQEINIELAREAQVK